MHKNVFAIALMWLTISPMVLLFPSNFPIYVFFCLKYITSIWFSLAVLNMEGFRPPFFFLHWSSELELKKTFSSWSFSVLQKFFSTHPLHSPICNSDCLLPLNRAFKWIRVANNFCEVAFSNGVITQWCTNVVFALLVGKLKVWLKMVTCCFLGKESQRLELHSVLIWGGLGGNWSHFDR